jgi:hypothetical protein
LGGLAPPQRNQLLDPGLRQARHRDVKQGRSRFREHAKPSDRRSAGLSGWTKKVSQETIRLCSWRIAALLQKQLPFCSRCVMSAHPKQPVV